MLSREDGPERPLEDDDIEILEIVGVDADGTPVDSAEEGEVLFEDVAPAPAEPSSSASETEVRERMIRMQADFENLRKQLDREREEYTQRATSGLVERLLSVLDNFERALAAAGTAETSSAFLNGIILIHHQMYDELRKEGLTPIDAVGEPFDPALHEAVATEDSSSLPPNTIVEEVQRGYYFQGRLLRPALVRVAVSREPGHSPRQGRGER